jgi:hypothetical protein
MIAAAWFMHREKRGTKSESPSEHSFSDLAEALDKQKAMTELVGHHTKIELPGNKMTKIRADGKAATR